MNTGLLAAVFLLVLALTGGCGGGSDGTAGDLGLADGDDLADAADGAFDDSTLEADHEGGGGDEPDGAFDGGIDSGRHER